MGYIYYNPNPRKKIVGDCTVRAISKALGQGWEKTYVGLALQGFCIGDMPSANAVWGRYIRSKGFARHSIPDSCPDCYSVQDFSAEHPKGVYVLALATHVVCLTDGDIYDTWDSREEPILYFWERENKK